ncbi:hypothetical protein CK203_114783 [Vitis vinifera]|uniref:Uncharacterized protein n=1 Tax=Vitis vinifera TaxID=29760 RepID=A0A438BPF3_VITVI|nr:hypothetical protein CK203_114783 [Vitis vinifera]
MEEKGKGSERWSAAIGNLSEMTSNLESLQKLLLKKAVFVDEETFAKASLSSEQARIIKIDLGATYEIRDSFNGGVVFQGAETGVVSLHGLLHGASIFPIANLVGAGVLVDP